jgi:hypothetical protein
MTTCVWDWLGNPEKFPELGTSCLANHVTVRGWILEPPLGHEHELRLTNGCGAAASSLVLRAGALCIRPEVGAPVADEWSVGVTASGECSLGEWLGDRVWCGG